MKANRMDQLMQRVEKALDEIRPFLRADEGDVQVLEITDDMIVKLQLLGACSSCNMSMMTMRAGIEQAILKSVPEIKSVQAVVDL